MKDKMFLIFDESKVDLEGKIFEFIKQKFGELFFDKIAITVSETESQEENNLDYDLNIGLRFDEFTYQNKAYGECTESIILTLENKGLQPFYIGGKFVSLNVFGWIQGSPIQQHNEIYGFSKKEIYDEFTDYMLTC